MAAEDADWERGWGVWLPWEARGETLVPPEGMERTAGVVAEGSGTVPVPPCMSEADPWCDMVNP